MGPAHVWTCDNCRTEQTHETYCPHCHTARYASWAIQFAEHICEHLADGVSEPLEMLKALIARPCYQRTPLQLSFVAQQMRLLTKDTTALARQIAKARSSRVMLQVLETGDNNHRIAVLRGIQVLGDVLEHKGELVTKHIVELHEGPPPVKSDG